MLRFAFRSPRSTRLASRISSRLREQRVAADLVQEELQRVGRALVRHPPLFGGRPSSAACRLLDHVDALGLESAVDLLHLLDVELELEQRLGDLREVSEPRSTPISISRWTSGRSCSSLGCSTIIDLNYPLRATTGRTTPDGRSLDLRSTAGDASNDPPCFEPGAPAIPLHVTALSLGPYQGTASYFVSRSGAGEAFVIDPGAEPATITAALSEAGAELRGDPGHARALRPRWCSRPDCSGPRMPSLHQFRREPYARKPGKEDAPGFRPLESYEADVKLQGDERFSIAGLARSDAISRRVTRPPALVFEITDPSRPGRAVRRRRDLPRLGRAHRLRRRLDLAVLERLDRTAVRDAARPTRRCSPATRARPTLADELRDEPVPRRRAPPDERDDHRVAAGHPRLAAGPACALRRAVIERAERDLRAPPATARS